MNKYIDSQLNENKFHIEKNNNGNLEQERVYAFALSNNSYVTYSIPNVYNTNYNEYNSYDCQRYVDYPCYLCHDREIWNVFGKKIITTTCWYDMCREWFESECFEYKINNFKVDFVLFIPKNYDELYGDIIRYCADRYAWVVEEELTLRLAGGLILTNISYDRLVKELINSTKNFKKLLLFCLFSKGVYDKSIVNSISILPQYEITTLSDWKPVLSGN